MPISQRSCNHTTRLKTAIRVILLLLTFSQTLAWVGRTYQSTRLVRVQARVDDSFLVLQMSASSSKDDDDDDDPVNSVPASPPPLVLHHAALKTRNITTAIQFYSLLDYKVKCKFRAGPARAAWLELDGTAAAAAARLELIEVPGYMLNEEPETRRRAIDLMARQDVLGYNHVALDVTAQMQSQNVTSLGDWMDLLNKRSAKKFGKFLRVALEPRQQIIGRLVFELGFIYDADGCLVELLHQQSELPQDLESGWEPWNGEGFIGGIELAISE